VRIFVTGGTGFLGGHLVRLLRERSDEVVALIRDERKAGRLREIGCALATGDVRDRDAVRRAIEGCDAAVHAAAIFEVGVPSSRRAEMSATNVGGTRNVLRAALDASVGKLVYVSTVAVYGNTRGEVASETAIRSGGYPTHYEWTKVQAHRVARRMIDQHGLPGAIVLPSTIYGPEDRSQLGQIVRQFLAGKAPAMLFPDTAGFSLVHVEDVARGIMLALERGTLGEEYILAGELTTMRAYIRRVAELTGRTPPERAVPPFMLRHVLPLLPRLAQGIGFPVDVREAVASLDGYTYWASHAKASRELGYEPRPLAEGLHDTLAVEGERGPQRSTPSSPRGSDQSPLVVAS
jgi:dihydroflavonol-4-reductase